MSKCIVGRIAPSPDSAGTQAMGTSAANQATPDGKSVQAYSEGVANQTSTAADGAPVPVAMEEASTALPRGPEHATLSEQAGRNI